MDRPTRKRGRPPKNGVTEVWRFVRALKAIYGYTKARERREKHWAAVSSAVEFVRQLNPRMSISETEVKRVLAKFLPQESAVAFWVDFVILEGEEAERVRRRFPQVPGVSGTKDLSDQNWRRPLKQFTLGFGKRPNYPRHNAKTSNP
jgi:hypothetical protein